MEYAIRDGELHLLKSETPCDAILSCKGCKLTAHKLILSIASPVLQELLLHDSTDITMLIFPEVNGNTMSLILDYIYNGSATIPACNLQEFLGISTLLKLQLDYKCSEKGNVADNYIEVDAEEYVHKKTLKKLPRLMPISKLQHKGIAAKKGLYNRVFPSPWCPRVPPLLADPRGEFSFINEQMSLMQHPSKDHMVEENDTNNNFQIRQQNTQPYQASSTILKNSLYNREKEKPIHQIINARVSRTASSAINSSSSSPVHTETEDEEKLDFFEQSITYKQEVLGNKMSNEVEEIEAGLKTEGNEEEVLEEAVNSPKTPESNEEEVVKNSNKANKYKPFKCHDCGKSFSQLRNYKYHRSIHEGTREFAARCPECGKIFNDRGYLSSHMKIHRDRKEYACPNCPKRFNQRVAYNMHLRIHTGIKPHECPTCGKTFSRKMLLKQHQRVHTGERPYNCPECGKSFADRSNMSLHTRLHTGVKPYACSLCPKTFTKKHHLKTHINFHTGVKPYSCQKCGLAFSQSSNMRTHYKKCVLKSSTQTISHNY